VYVRNNNVYVPCYKNNMFSADARIRETFVQLTHNPDDGGCLIFLPCAKRANDNETTPGFHLLAYR